MTDRSIISTEPGPTSPTLASQPTLRLNQCPLAFAFGIGLIVLLFLFGTGIGSAQTVSPVLVQGTCAAFLEEVKKGIETISGTCDWDRKPVNGRCPDNAGQTVYDIRWNFAPGSFEVVTSGYYCSCDGRYSTTSTECAATCSTGANCSAQQCIPIKPIDVCVKDTIPPAGRWMSVPVSSKMLVWDTNSAGLPSSGFPDCSKENEAYEKRVRDHEEHHVNDKKTLSRKYFENSVSVDLVGCSANKDGARKAFLEFRRRLGKSVADELDRIFTEATNSFHQSPEGAPFSLIDCSKCPAVPTGSKGWCTILPKGALEPWACGFGTASQACEKQRSEFTDKDIVWADPVKVETTARWYQNNCKWETTGGVTAGTQVEFKCESDKLPTAPWSCPPP
jgi:hypothetical protein